MKIGPVIGCIFIFLMFALLLSITVISIMETIENIVIKIRKRKRKKIIKRLKEAPTWDQTCINLLKGLQEEDGNDRN